MGEEYMARHVPRFIFDAVSLLGVERRNCKNMGMTHDVVLRANKLPLVSSAQ